MPSAAESSLLSAVSSWTVGSGVVRERSRDEVRPHAMPSLETATPRSREKGDTADRTEHTYRLPSSPRATSTKNATMIAVMTTSPAIAVATTSI